MDHWSQRLRETLHDRRISVASFSRMTGIKDTLLRKYLDGAVQQPRGNIMEQLADTLGIREEWLRKGTGPQYTLSEVNTSDMDTKTPQSKVGFDLSQSTSEIANSTFADSTTAQIGRNASLTVASDTISPNSWAKDIPVRGTAAGSEMGSFQLVDEVVEYIRRPEALKNKSVYALYIQNDSMEPRYMPGEVVIVDEVRPPQVGDYVIIQTSPDGIEVQSMVKRLVRRSGSTVIVHQHNPEKDLEIPTKSIVAIHRIIPWVEVHGF